MRLSSRVRLQRGLTMIEVLVATIILSVILAMSSYLVWSSSKTVTSAEVMVQCESQAREFLSNLEKELRMAKMDKIDIVDWTSIPVYTPATLVGTPGTVLGVKIPYTASLASTYQVTSDLTVRDPVLGTYYPNVVPFHAIRFRIPGTAMDLTKNTANWDANHNNFNLAAYKANGSNDQNYTTEIMYWFEIDGDNTRGTGLTRGEGTPNTPGCANGLGPDGLDNNANGVKDEGVIKRLETTFDINGNAISRKMSTVVRDVAWDPNNNPGGSAILGLPKGAPSFVWMVYSTDVNGLTYNGANKRIYVTLTLEKQDPQHVGHPEYNFKKTVGNFIDLRGI